jgi:hypothetical protein
MTLREAVKKIQDAKMQASLEGKGFDQESGSGLRLYARSDENGYESYITVPIGVHDHLDDDEVATLERVIAERRRNAD